MSPTRWRRRCADRSRSTPPGHSTERAGHCSDRGSCRRSPCSSTTSPIRAAGETRSPRSITNWGVARRWRATASRHCSPRCGSEGCTPGGCWAARRRNSGWTPRSWPGWVSWRSGRCTRWPRPRRRGTRRGSCAARTSWNGVGGGCSPCCWATGRCCRRRCATWRTAPGGPCRRTSRSSSSRPRPTGGRSGRWPPPGRWWTWSPGHHGCSCPTRTGRAASAAGRSRSRCGGGRPRSVRRFRSRRPPVRCAGPPGLSG